MEYRVEERTLPFGWVRDGEWEERWPEGLEGEERKRRERDEISWLIPGRGEQEGPGLGAVTNDLFSSCSRPVRRLVSAS